MEASKEWVRRNKDDVHSSESLANGILADRISELEIGLEAVMEDSSKPEPNKILQRLLKCSSSSSGDNSMHILIEKARTVDGRSELASKNILPLVLELIQSLPYPCDSDTILLSLKLLRNLCAGEISNQNSFIENNGLKIVSSVLNSVEFGLDSDFGIVRMGLQLLGNAALAGEEHQLAIWSQFFPNEFTMLSRVHRREISDPLCMVIYTCCDGNKGRLLELCGDQGLQIIAEIVRTASSAGYGEEWFELLLSRICLDEFHFPQLFSTLYSASISEDDEFIKAKNEPFASEQAYLLKIVSQILNEHLTGITVYKDFALCALQIFKKAVDFTDFVSKGCSNLPTGSTRVDILGYSLIILRDICSLDGLDAVDSLLSSGLLEIVINLLRDLGPPSIVKKAVNQEVDQEGLATSSFSKRCPYKGFRRDIVAVIGNCAYGKKHVQDEIREKDALFLLLQQCVTDEDNPFLREWGIWAAKNLLENNTENQRQVAELELQETVNLPELARLGLRVDIDKATRRTKLVNT